MQGRHRMSQAPRVDRRRAATVAGGRFIDTIGTIVRTGLANPWGLAGRAFK
jgi:hypothetical protein